MLSVMHRVTCVKCHLSSVKWIVSSIMCHLSSMKCNVSIFIFQVSSVMCKVSCIKCHRSDKYHKCHLSSVMCLV